MTQNYLLVHSRAATTDGKYLSTFVLNKICHLSKVFPSVEHAFQFSKLSYLDSEISDAMYDKLYNHVLGLSPPEAKSFGSKTNFKKLKINLNTELWNKNSVSVMKTLLIERSKNDLLFNEIIKKFDKIYHYERSGPKSFWGGSFKKNTKVFVGVNMYGKLLEELKS
jgi:hypothetical protein